MALLYTDPPFDVVRQVELEEDVPFVETVYAPGQVVAPGDRGAFKMIYRIVVRRVFGEQRTLPFVVFRSSFQSSAASTILQSRFDAVSSQVVVDAIGHIFDFEPAQATLLLDPDF